MGRRIMDTFRFIMSIFFIGAIVATACSVAKKRPNAEASEASRPLNLGKTQGAGEEISSAAGKNYKSGQVLVKFKPQVSKGEIDKIARIAGLEVMKVVYPPNLILFKIMGSSSVGDVIRSLKGVEEVEYAEPNYHRKPF
jgi:hypothetical protein